MLLVPPPPPPPVVGRVCPLAVLVPVGCCCCSARGSSAESCSSSSPSSPKGLRIWSAIELIRLLANPHNKKFFERYSKARRTVILFFQEGESGLAWNSFVAKSSNDFLFLFDFDRISSNLLFGELLHCKIAGSPRQTGTANKTRCTSQPCQTKAQLPLFHPLP